MTGERMAYVVSLEEVDRSQAGRVGGKGASLGELSRIRDVSVPAGFCVTTEAFRRIVSGVAAVDVALDHLSGLGADDQAQIRALAAEIREAIEGVAIPEDLAWEVARALAGLGEDGGYAVRSSATVEDSPGASFAGQHDSYLNVSGAPAILAHVRRCWASLFTERAVTYRQRNGLDHRSVQMAVVVQRMVSPQAAGVLFTADPVSSNRKVASVEAGSGLGEALVSGLVNPDVYKVRGGEIVERTVVTDRPVLTDGQVLRLVELGRRLEAHLGHPQDIEWCLAGDEFHIVQSRPITTLFPIPAAGDADNHVYVSVGHQQMMTDAIKPLGLSFWQRTAARPMPVAGGRLFVDVTGDLASPAGRARLASLRMADPLTGDALETVLERGDFVALESDDGPDGAPGATPPPLLEADPALVSELMRRSSDSISALQRDIGTKAGAALLDFIEEDIRELKRILLDPRSMQVIMAGMRASWWLNERMEAWLGEKNAADTLSRSVSHNITSEMGLELVDVAAVIERHAEVLAYLQDVDDDRFLDGLPAIPGGQQARDAIQAYLDKYGMRCVGEIDITRPRWSERPVTLVPLILGNIRNRATRRRFEQGRQAALEKAEELLARLRALPDGELKAAETKAMIDRVRTFSGYREYPKYGIVSRYFVYKRALLREAARLVHIGALQDVEDIFYLTFDELREAVRTSRVDHDLVRRRNDAHRSYQALTPPRVLTSDGEVISGAYRRDDVPAGALVGLPVSAGTVEGRARVISDIADAELEPGDILVTAYTDPSWTPLFVAIKGLVTEVGGLMTHGAVIAREYGVPAVVAVDQATHLLQDGQRIRVNGSDGYIEILSAPVRHDQPAKE